MIDLFSSLIVHPPRIYRALYPDALWRVKTTDKNVYLTFDDGPSPQTTPFILEQLEKLDAKATFFVVGENAQRYPSLIKQIREQGHSLGNHTMHHLQGIKNKKSRYLADIENESILLGTRLFRPPHGLMKPAQYHAIRKQYNIVMYDIVTKDYDGRMTSAKIERNVKRYVQPGSTIVFHDSVKAMPRLFETLPAVMQWLKQQGYGFKALPMD